MRKFGFICLWIICFVLIDVVICRQFLNLGHPRDFDIYKSKRPPVPYAEFTSEKLLEETSFDKTKFWENKNSLKVAFFAGSTGMRLEQKKFSEHLTKLFNEEVELVNFSMYSGNHSQHLHLLLEILHNDVPDIVIFYGGYNETITQGNYDPRPGFPYSYYYRGELSPLKRVLLEKSALFGALEWKYGLISHINHLRNEYKPFSPEWNKTIENKYFEKLELVKRVTESLPSKRYGKTKFIAFYQPYRSDLHSEFYDYHKNIRNRIQEIDYIIDLHDLYEKLGNSVYYDDCHVNSIANNLLIETISEKVANKFANEK